MLKMICIGVLSAWAGSLATVALVTNSDRVLSSVVLDEYLTLTCHDQSSAPLDRKPVLLGEFQALSRIANRTGLAPIAWSEYLKCKVMN